MSRADTLKSKMKAGSSPFAASHKSGKQRSTSSVYSRDPPTSSKSNKHHAADDHEVQLIGTADGRTGRNLRSTQAHERRRLEQELGLARPRTVNGEGSSHRPVDSRLKVRQLTSDEEVPEPVESQFPLQRTTRDTLSAPRSSRRNGVRDGRAERAANSSPSRPMNRTNQPRTDVSSSEEEERVEEQRQPQPESRPVLSSDEEPPKLLRRSQPAVSSNSNAHATTKRALMRKKDGTRPPEVGGARIATFPPVNASVPSSEVSAIPAAITWAIVEAGDSNHEIRARSVSLRRVGTNKDHVLELDADHGLRACLPLANVTGLQVGRLQPDNTDDSPTMAGFFGWPSAWTGATGVI